MISFIPALDRMLSMACSHLALEEEEAALRSERDEHTDEQRGGKIEMPAEDTHRTVQFDEPKKNPP
ncbi:hypothetical protein H0Z09_26960 [Pseudomonas sp. SWRI18]|uniref:hypothetical protein n=1 Tax=Pseudomonas sp. SWRI18 TaxID=2753888 RepID=UPI00164509BD|nr:hypothetical protein [Pseudomonas sp. SWRI18]MBC3304779.1 hypothetical protein [Pseudomonas sp. SWRI18]